MRREQAAGFDRDLADLPQAERWRLWRLRLEAVLFASATPVAEADLARVVGRDAALGLLLEDLAADLAERPYELAAVGGGWMLRSRKAFAPVIRAAADVEDQTLDLRPFDAAVLAAIAWHQPVTRSGLQEIFGRPVNRDLIGRLHALELIATGPRSPRPGAPYTYVTTAHFLTVFGLQSLRDLPEADLLQDAGLLKR